MLCYIIDIYRDGRAEVGSCIVILTGGLLSSRKWELYFPLCTKCIVNYNFYHNIDIFAMYAYKLQ